TLADYGGQVWTVRFWEPGERDTSGGKPGQVKNWFAARAFHVAMDNAQQADDHRVRPPLTYIAPHTLHPHTGHLRTCLGTGDRYNRVDKAPRCRLSNPRACAELGCAVRTRLDIHRDSVAVSQGDSHFKDYQSAELQTPTTSDGGNACVSPKV